MPNQSLAARHPRVPRPSARFLAARTPLKNLLAAHTLAPHRQPAHPPRPRSRSVAPYHNRRQARKKALFTANHVLYRRLVSIAVASDRNLLLSTVHTLIRKATFANILLLFSFELGGDYVPPPSRRQGSGKRIMGPPQHLSVIIL